MQSAGLLHALLYAVGLIRVPLPVLAEELLSPLDASCRGTQCFAVFSLREDFHGAMRQCAQRRGILMTVRSTVSRDALGFLLNRVPGRFWIGLNSSSGCPDTADGSQGFRWVTGEPETDWSADGGCSARCVTVSREDGFRFTPEPCGDAPHGFLCEFRFQYPCSPLAPGSVATYRLPFGLRGGSLRSLPPGSVYPPGSVTMSGDSAWRCAAGAWVRAPWSCEMEEGGHACTCGQGFELAEDGRTCTDIDDCAHEGRCPDRKHVCVNTAGSFRCACPSGYKSTGATCVDVDECVPAPCEHLCVNTAGSFRCACYEGYRLTSSAPERCELHCGRQECPAECDPNDPTLCACPENYILDAKEAGRMVCVDIDECAMGACEQVCVNKYGSYSCSCHKGFTLGSRNRCVQDWGEATTEDWEGSSSWTTPGPGPTGRTSRLTAGALLGISVSAVVSFLIAVVLVVHLLGQRNQEERDLQQDLDLQRDVDWQRDLDL